MSLEVNLRPRDKQVVIVEFEAYNCWGPNELTIAGLPNLSYFTIIFSNKLDVKSHLMGVVAAFSLNVGLPQRHLCMGDTPEHVTTRDPHHFL